MTQGGQVRSRTAPGKTLPVSSCGPELPCYKPSSNCDHSLQACFRDDAIVGSCPSQSAKSSGSGFTLAMSFSADHPHLACICFVADTASPGHASTKLGRYQPPPINLLISDFKSVPSYRVSQERCALNRSPVNLLRGRSLDSLLRLRHIGQTRFTSQGVNTPGRVGHPPQRSGLQLRRILSHGRTDPVCFFLWTLWVRSIRPFRRQQWSQCRGMQHVVASTRALVSNKELVLATHMPRSVLHSRRGSPGSSGNGRKLGRCTSCLAIARPRA